MMCGTGCGQSASHLGCLQPCSSKPRYKEGCETASPLYSTDEFRMYCFKILPCSKRYSHDWVTCPFAHPGEKARRRCVRAHQYGSNACPEMQRDGRCPRGDACPMAHSVFEFWLHPNRYRTQLCNDGDKCTRRICFFAHSISTLRAPAMQHYEQQQQQQQQQQQRQRQQRQQQHHNPILCSMLGNSCSSSSLVGPSAGSFTSGSTSLTAVGSPLSSASLTSPETHSTALPAWHQCKQQRDVITCAAVANAAAAADGAVVSGCDLLVQQQPLPVQSGGAGVGCFLKHSSMLNSTNPTGKTLLSAQLSLAAQQQRQQLARNSMGIAAHLQQLQLQAASAAPIDATELLCQLLLQACQADAANSQLLSSCPTLTGPAGHVTAASATQSIMIEQHLGMPVQHSGTAAAAAAAAAAELASTSAAWPIDAGLLSYASLPAQFEVSSSAACNGLLQQNNHEAHSSSARAYGSVLAASLGAPLDHML